MMNKHVGHLAVPFALNRQILSLGHWAIVHGEPPGFLSQKLLDPYLPCRLGALCVMYI